MKFASGKPEKKSIKRNRVSQTLGIFSSRHQGNVATSRQFCHRFLSPGTFIVICLALLQVIILNQPRGLLEARGPKPPRGYCTQISRAIGPSSRCYEHLIGNSKAQRQSKVSSGNTIKHHNDLAKDNDASQQLLAGEAGRVEDEELVYVRLETIGSTIRDLNVRAINERLLVGVSRRLLGTSETRAIHKSGDDSMAADVRAQILGGGALADGVQGSKLADKCRLSIEKFLCRMVYPVCHFRRADVSALVRPPCREDCLLLRDVLCSNLDWSQFITVLGKAFNETLLSTINSLDLKAEGEENLEGSQQQDYAQAGNFRTTNLTLDSKTSELGVSSPPSVHLYWPHEQSIHKCEGLPPLRPTPVKHHNRSTATGHHNQKFNGRSARRRRRRFFMHNLTPDGEQLKWPICSNAYLTSATPLSDQHQELALWDNSRECLESEDGLEYMGTQNKTGSGRVCQQWQSQQPHAHKSSELLFDNMRGAHNYCRNPGGVELKPWCYTVDSNVRWEFCDIPGC